MDLLFGLLDHIDKCLDDVIFFADEGGSGEVGVNWEKVLPVWFKVLSATAEPEEYADRIKEVLSHHYSYGRDKMLVIARRIATPDQRKAPRSSKSYQRRKRVGHHCRSCGRSRPNEQFSGRGHRTHFWKECQRLPREKLDRIDRFDELHRFLRQSMVSARNPVRLEALTRHENRHAAELAALILEIARVLPGKRNRWLKPAQRHRSLFDRRRRVHREESRKRVGKKATDRNPR